MSTIHQVIVNLPTQENAQELAGWLDAVAEDIEETHGIQMGRITVQSIERPNLNAGTECEVCGSTDGTHYDEMCFK